MIKEGQMPYFHPRPISKPNVFYQNFVLFPLVGNKNRNQILLTSLRRTFIPKLNRKTQWSSKFLSSIQRWPWDFSNKLCTTHNVASDIICRCSFHFIPDLGRSTCLIIIFKIMRWVVVSKSLAHNQVWWPWRSALLLFIISSQGLFDLVNNILFHR